MKKRLLVFGMWTLLIIACGAFRHWRFERLLDAWWHAREGADFPFFPVWFLFVDAALIALGFALVATRRFAGRTPAQRYGLTVYVGCWCVIAVGNVLVDVGRQLLFTRPS